MFVITVILALGLLVLLPSEIRISKRALSVVTMGFIYIPIVIFLFGFTKIYWALAASLCILYGFYGFVKHSQKLSSGENEYITINRSLFVVCLLLCLLAGVISGWGGIFSQREDWDKTNAVLRDLVEYDWPVYYVNGEERSALSYYIGGYLVPALTGKVSHSFDVAESTLLLYFSAGLFLLFLNAILYIKISDPKKVITFFFGLLLFSGALILAQILIGNLYPGTDWFWSGGDIRGEGLRLCYRSTMIDLRWVPNQYIFPCLCGMVFLQNRNDVSHYVWSLLPALLYGAFSFMGVVPVAFFCAVWYLTKKEMSVRDIFSLSNIVTSLTLGLVLIAYFWGNISAEKPAGMAFGFESYGSGRFLGVYVIFCLFMFGIQAALVWKRYKKDPVFLSVIILLLLIPFERMGIENDWILGVPTIPLFFLMIFIWDYVFNEKKDKLRKGVLIALLCIGAIYPAGHICQAVGQTISQYETDGRLYGRRDGYGTMQRYANRSLDDDPALIYNYFTYDLDDDIFYRYIARKKLSEDI